MNGKKSVFSDALGILLATITLIVSPGTVGPAMAAQQAHTTRITAEDRVPVDPAEWAKGLEQFVRVEGPASRVNYAGLMKDHGDLDRYLAAVQTVTQTQFDSLTEKQKIAFLVNAYNALTIRLILNHYPVKSIKDIGSLFSSPWKKRFFTLFGTSHSLDDIEQGILRKQFTEPRIHFALVCASKGCPQLRPEPYLASRLDEQLNDAARIFLRDPLKNHFDATSHMLSLSSIFKWYGEDFVKKYGSVKAFVAPRITDDAAISAQILSAQTRIQFLDYDWSLNGN